MCVCVCVCVCVFVKGLLNTHEVHSDDGMCNHVLFEAPPLRHYVVCWLAFQRTIYGNWVNC